MLRKKTLERENAREREREFKKARKKSSERESVCVCVCKRESVSSDKCLDRTRSFHYTERAWRRWLWSAACVPSRVTCWSK